MDSLFRLEVELHEEGVTGPRVEDGVLTVDLDNRAEVNAHEIILDGRTWVALWIRSWDESGGLAREVEVARMADIHLAAIVIKEIVNTYEQVDDWGGDES